MIQSVCNLLSSDRICQTQSLKSRDTCINSINLTLKILVSLRTLDSSIDTSSISKNTILDNVHICLDTSINSRCQIRVGLLQLAQPLVQFGQFCDLRNASVVSTVAFVICTRYESASSTHQEGREEQNTS